MKEWKKWICRGALPALMVFGTSPASASLWTSGHGDLGIEFDEVLNELEPHWHLEGGIVNGVPQDDVEFEADELTVVVPKSTFDYRVSLGGRPAGTEWDPLGVAAGEGFWFLPSIDGGPGGAAALGAPFVGIGSEALDPLDWTGSIELALQSVSGPGDFALWQVQFGTPLFFMSSFDGIDGSDVYEIGVGGHDHANWGFTAPGLYEITFVASGTHVTEGLIESDPTTFSFNVIPEPSSIGLLLFGAVAASRVRRSRAKA